ncbi:membrane protein insertion efficiency factor YidD [Rhodospirillaceae bacterium SYSU D60014]|uniref:membrane protein insertion efficiency factor YidD n=1 Tax=Virgifigura deserti TaxID=2268457 RepID=UPI000E6634FA
MRLARAACIGCIRAYQILISPVLPPTCRFAPSCSAYAGEAIALHGVMTGLWLATRRILRCHPWGGSGFDPVPQPNHSVPDHPGCGCADRAR